MSNVQLAHDDAERIPRAGHRELTWASHLPSLERPDLMDGLLVDHLAG